MLRLILIGLLLFSTVGFALNGQPLPPDEAFKLQTYYVDKDKTLILEWKIAPGYFLYRNKLQLTLSPTSRIKLGDFMLPPGMTHRDEFKNEAYQTYSDTVKIAVPLKFLQSGLLNLSIGYQGCSQQGFCYSPIEKKLQVNLQPDGSKNLTQFVSSPTPKAVSERESLPLVDRMWEGHNVGFIMLSCLGFGLLLAFTPCVLPMVPILSSIVIGQNKKSKKARGFSISLAYVFGMALTYAIAGMMIALIGSNLQAELQKPWIIFLFSGMFILLALSLFGFYELQIPLRWQRLINALSNRQKGGTYLGAFVMGSLSTLVVSPCVSAPLIGILAYIGHSGDVVLGAASLFTLGLGMGLPLLLVGISAEKILPKAGSWMLAVERFFGFVMLGLAIWMMSRMVSGPTTLFLWSLLVTFIAVYLYFFVSSSGVTVRNIKDYVVKGSAVVVFVYGIILMVGAILGNSDPLYPWSEIGSSQESPSNKVTFIRIRNMAEFDHLIKTAKQAKKIVVLDFYADWCFSCVTMDRTVFSKEEVKDALSDKLVLRADLTQNTIFDHELLHRFKVIGPPTILFFNEQGDELAEYRLVGETNARPVVSYIKKIEELKRVQPH